MTNQKRLVDKILQSSEYINKLYSSGSANYIITSSQVFDLVKEVYREQKSKYRKEKINKLFNE